MKLGKPLATGVAEERPVPAEDRPETRPESERSEQVRPEPVEAPAGR